MNPQAGLAFDLQGADSHALTMIAPPTFASQEEAAEIVEIYWMALLRDVNFNDYGTNPEAAAAASELSSLAGYKGPKTGGVVDPATQLFRGHFLGNQAGPYLSQFLLLPARFGSLGIDMRQRTYVPGDDYMTDFTDWLGVQDGQKRGPNNFDPSNRYIRNGRDISAFVHIDVLYQSYFNACLTLLDVNAPLNPGNPYFNSKNQEGFGTFGPPHIKTIVAEVSTRALKAVWYQKWAVHRRLRPEAFGGAIHNVKTNAAGYPVHVAALNSDALVRVQTSNPSGSWLLPMAFPEGSPIHPAYGQGHATVAGACVTILKAFFDGKAKIADLLSAAAAALTSPYPYAGRVVANNMGTNLVPYAGVDAGLPDRRRRLNKVAANIALGRCHAGVHWRSDYTESLKLGEALAISILRDQKSGYNEEFSGLKFRKFDGSPVTI